MNTEDKVNALGILTPSDHALSSSLKRVFEVDAVPQFRDLLKALDLADDCGPSAPQPDFPVITNVNTLASLDRPATARGEPRIATPRRQNPGL
ncbi:MAG: hypothetical protein Q8R44_07410 [Novosphingobium sp.]|nr:hypothetical protein [Novosphingobium sp.]